ncbi:penicillin-binding transpeptidase domain-containing protein [Nocardioides ferulae]|uniref:penicillin-binding transpeptidase domain-containing protein n=1 Tax=Nocardioides ferulae TaxID=2340821 RepID=UPI000EAC70EB|nr:penicillin-binding transpeptidase domain-containing protein [Nocardioides ferulae]
MPRLPVRTPRRAVATLLGAALALGLSACEGDADPPDGAEAAEAARELAAALSAGDLDGVDFRATDGPDASAALDLVTEGMGETEPSVEVTEVVDGDDSARVELTWSWPVADKMWSYPVETRLTLVDDEWQAGWSPSLVHPSLKEHEVLALSTEGAERGDVLGADGRALVTARPVVRFGIDRSQVPERRAGAAAGQLARLVGIDVAPYVDRVEAAGDRAFVEAIVFRADELPARVEEGYELIPGVLALADELPLAPTPEFAAPLLGSVGEVTAEMIEEQPERYQLGDRAGLSGLQARYDEQLQGRPGAVVLARDEQQDERELFRVPARPGRPLRLTLHLDLQREAERLLAQVRPASALVALRPSTGDLLVVANGPGTEGYNMASFGQFAPGSTFKIVSSLALLRSGLTPDSPLECPDTTTVEGKQFENYDDYPSSAVGRIALRTAVAHSCNTAFVAQTGRLGADDLAGAAASLGLGVDHDLGFPAYFGSVPPPASDVELAADLIGQGKVLASPMAMAAVIGSVQRGELVVPRLLEQVEVSAPDGVAPLTGDEANALRAMLRGVVTTGSGAGLADLPGSPAIAKTGTAEFERGGRLRTHAWMVAAQGDLAVAVFVEEGASGSGTAGPILESFLRAAGAIGVGG